MSAEDYDSLMMDNIDVDDKWFVSLQDIEKEKLGVARTYNRKVRFKAFHVGDLVWKAILPVGSISQKFGKWS